MDLLKDIYSWASLQPMYIKLGMIIFLGAGAALGVALLGGLFPSLEASRTLPREALYRGTLERRLHMNLGKISLVGTVVLGLGYFCSQQPPVDGLPLFGLVAAFFRALGHGVGFYLCLVLLHYEDIRTYISAQPAAYA